MKELIISPSLQEIIFSLNLFDLSFGKLFDGMYQDTAWDISSDISTMKTMIDIITILSMKFF